MGQGGAFVAVRWCDCTVGTHLQKSAADAVTGEDSGSSHPGAGSFAVQVCLCVPTAVSRED